MLKIKVPKLVDTSNSWITTMQKFDPVSNIAKDLNTFMSKMDIMEPNKIERNRPKTKIELLDTLINDIIDLK
jgi:hypothetical protein